MRLSLVGPSDCGTLLKLKSYFLQSGCLISTSGRHKNTVAKYFAFAGHYKKTKQFDLKEEGPAPAKAMEYCQPQASCLALRNGIRE